MTKDEALKLALEALEYRPLGATSGEKDLNDRAITAIQEALAQPEQEPIGWTSRDYVTGDVKVLWGRQPPLGPLYTTPPNRKPLTNEQKLMCWSRATCDADVEHKTEHQCLMDYGAEIEAAHGIGEKPDAA